MISQIVAGTALAVFARTAENSAETYYNYTIFLTGLTGILAMIPALYFYRRDKVRRIASGLIPAQKKVPLSISETVLLLLAGAGFAQYGNFLMAILQSFINSSTYQESMTRITEGKSLLMMIFWMGIIAPAAEEMIFRWLIYLRLRDWLKLPVAAVISGLIFGIYHGNIVQGIYASILGICMDTGNEWKYLQQYAAPYGSKHLVTAYLRICTGFVFHEIWGTDSHINLSDSVDQCGILPYPFRKDVQYKKKEKNDIKIETR